MARVAISYCVVGVYLTLLPGAAIAQSFFTGTATYRERMALPAGAVLEVTVEDVSRTDAPAEIIASTRVESPGLPPIPFRVEYDQRRILSKGRYVVRARIVGGGALLFTTDPAVPVLTADGVSPVALMLRRVSERVTTPVPVARAARPGPLRAPVRSRGPATWTCTRAGAAPDTVRLTVYDTQPALAVLESGGVTRLAFQVRAASGVRYEGDGVLFWEARGEAAFTWMGTESICKPN